MKLSIYLKLKKNMQKFKLLLIVFTIICTLLTIKTNEKQIING